VTQITRVQTRLHEESQSHVRCQGQFTRTTKTKILKKIKSKKIFNKINCREQVQGENDDEYCQISGRPFTRDKWEPRGVCLPLNSLLLSVLTPPHTHNNRLREDSIGRDLHTILRGQLTYIPHALQVLGM
jgi:hypothetical protein